MATSRAIDIRVDDPVKWFLNSREDTRQGSTLVAVDWHTLGVWVPLREIDSIGGRIRAFHVGVGGDEAFAAAQERCLRTYREVLAPFPVHPAIAASAGVVATRSRRVGLSPKAPIRAGLQSPTTSTTGRTFTTEEHSVGWRPQPN